MLDPIHSGNDDWLIIDILYTIYSYLITLINININFIRCTSKPVKSDAIMLIVTLTSVLLITSFCYASIIYEINNQKLNNEEQIRAHVSKKISGYILIFILQ